MTTIRVLELGIARAYVLEGAGGRVLVDGGVAGGSLIAALAAAGIGPGDIGLALVTHAHTDHYGGIPALAAAAASGRALGLACGRADAEAMASGRNPILAPVGLRGALAARASASRPAGASRPGPRASLLLDGGESLLGWGVDAEVVAVPGHTPGSVAVIVPAAVDGSGGELGKAAVVGDLVMGGFILHRRPGPPFFASGMDELRSSLATLRDRGVRTIYPGHGGPLDALRVWRRFGL